MKFKKIYVEITNKCNLNCSFCSKLKRELKTMSKDEFKHVISEIKPYTDYIYLHLKGEPLIHPDLEDILKIAKENNIIVNITTNGTKLSDTLDIIKKYGWKYFFATVGTFFLGILWPFGFFFCYMFKDEKGIGKISYTNSELSEKINMPESTISKCNRSLTTKEYLSIIRCEKHDPETGLAIQEKIFHLDELGQAVIWALQNHEQRITKNEKTLDLALKEIAQLKAELAELKGKKLQDVNL